MRRRALAALPRRRAAAISSVALVVLCALAVGACASPDRPSVQADAVPRPTPLASVGPTMAATIDELGAAVAAVGERLAPAIAAYQPSEPAALLQAPRVVLRADLADAEDGFVVVYDAEDEAQAAEWAGELARYLGSGFGQATFTADTRLSVAVRQDAVIFTSWSPGRSSHPARAERVFDALAAVGAPVEIVR